MTEKSSIKLEKARLCLLMIYKSALIVCGAR